MNLSLSMVTFLKLMEAGLRPPSTVVRLNTWLVTMGEAIVRLARASRRSVRGKGGSGPAPLSCPFLALCGSSDGILGVGTVKKIRHFDLLMTVADSKIEMGENLNMGNNLSQFLPQVGIWLRKNQNAASRPNEKGEKKQICC